MIVSHRHKFIFVKTRKTAGTSLEIALSEHCGPNDVITALSGDDERHRRALGFRGAQNVDIPLRRHSPRQLAGVVRHHRIRTLHNHFAARRIRQAVGPDVWDDYLTFTVERNPFDKAISRYWWSTGGDEPRPSFDEFVLHRSLSDWPLYTIGDVVAVDFVLRYERLAGDLETLSDRLGLPIRLPEQRAKGEHRLDRRHYRIDAIYYKG